MSLMVGERAPGFRCLALNGGDIQNIHLNEAFFEATSEDYEGKWLVLFFYPFDFSFVCPTELEEFGKAYPRFQEEDCEVLASSTDSHYSHHAWRVHHPTLKNLPYAMLADFNGEIARRFDVFKEEDGSCKRGLFIIDPNWTVQYLVVHNDDVGRSSEETLRVLKALKTGKLTPCNWHEGDETID